MTANPVTATLTTSLRDAIRLVRDLDVRHLPVVSEGRVVGILSDRDLREALGPLLGSLPDERSAALLSRPASQLMSTDVVTVQRDTELGDVVDLMIEERIGAVPVVDGTTRKLVGIVSYVDVLRAARDRF